MVIPRWISSSQNFVTPVKSPSNQAPIEPGDFRVPSGLQIEPRTNGTTERSHRAGRILVVASVRAREGHIHLSRGSTSEEKEQRGWKVAFGAWRGKNEAMDPRSQEKDPTGLELRGWNGKQCERWRGHVWMRVSLFTRQGRPLRRCVGCVEPRLLNGCS
eukprot:scaffold927_cov310-Pavlova_lutheri.AAC.4